MEPALLNQLIALYCAFVLLYCSMCIQNVALLRAANDEYYDGLARVVIANHLVDEHGDDDDENERPRKKKPRYWMSQQSVGDCINKFLY